MKLLPGLLGISGPPISIAILDPVTSVTGGGDKDPRLNMHCPNFAT